LFLFCFLICGDRADCRRRAGIPNGNRAHRDIFPNFISNASSTRRRTGNVAATRQPPAIGTPKLKPRARHCAGLFVTGRREADLKDRSWWDQERESSESPMLNAFCRVAPSVLFNFLAILAAGVFLRAMVLSSRTSPEVHARRFFDFLGINPPYQIGSWYPLAGAEEIEIDCISIMNL
jgi:hypothetical protein